MVAVVAHLAHNQEVGGANPSSASMNIKHIMFFLKLYFINKLLINVFITIYYFVSGFINQHIDICVIIKIVNLDVYMTF